MNCNDFELNVLRLARNGLIDAAARKLCLNHVEACARCAHRLAEERALLAGIRSVVAEIAAEEAPARVEDALLAAFRDHVSPSISISPIPITNRRRWHWQFAAAAAIILVLISVGAILWLHRVRNPEPEVKTTPAPVISPKSTDQPTAPDMEIAQQPHRPQPQSRVHQPASRRASAPSEQVTEFFPLMDGADLNSLEAVQVVRVELPASELRNFGLPIAAEMASVPVKADVVLGYDGQARAIRFVQ